MSKPDKTQNAGGGLLKFAFLAGILGLLFGAGLYAFLDTGGNGTKTVASADTCTVDTALQTKLDGAAQGHVAAFKAADRPFSASQLAFNDESGTTKNLGDWTGKTVLFNLWATWCAPCRAEMPALDSLQKQLGDENFEVVAVSVDLGDPAKPKKFYRDIGLKHMRFFHDPELNTLNTLKSSGLAYGLPATLLISKTGCVLGALNGPAEWAQDDAKALIRLAF